MPWQEVRPGVRHKVHRENGRQLRLIEFQTSEGFNDWCEQGHIGYVLAGGLQIDCNGTVVSFEAGDGLFIPAGSESRHRGVVIAPGTRLVMVEEVEE
jgi:mannose-6-phosphate isomerase-like protein (cupin superfamily)